MTIITLHHLFFGHCVNLSVISHNDLKKDDAQLLLSKSAIKTNMLNLTDKDEFL